VIKPLQFSAQSEFELHHQLEPSSDENDELKEGQNISKSFEPTLPQQDISDSDSLSD
jgi:hypothetical protein